MQKEKIIIDCDPGTDDALVIAMALGSPNVEILGITTVAGNRDLERTTANALKTLEYFERTDIPVYSGSEKPRSRPLFIPPATSIHGRDGLGDCDLPSPKTPPRKGATVFISTQLKKYPGEVTLFAIGPLTNIARVFKIADPSTIKQIYLMNGAFWVAGNATEFAEFNAFVDPEAAAIVYGAGIPMKVVGLDVTNPVVITPKEFKYLRQFDTPEVKFFVKINENPLSRKQKDTFSIFWDAIAMAWFLDPELIRAKRGSVSVETAGKRAGMTRFSEGDGTIEVGAEIDSAGFFEVLWKFFGVRDRMKPS